MCLLMHEREPLALIILGSKHKLHSLSRKKTLYRSICVCQIRKYLGDLFLIMPIMEDIMDYYILCHVHFLIN